MLTLDVDTNGLDAIAARLSATVESYVSKEARIPQTGLRRRLFSRVEDGELLKIWVGGKPVSPMKIGNPEVYIGGVKVGRHNFPGSWLGDVYSSGYEKIWIRLHSKYYSRELYPTIYRAGDRGMARDHRFPVVRAAIPVEQYMDAFIRSNKGGLEYAFLRDFEKALKAEVING